MTRSSAIASACLLAIVAAASVAAPAPPEQFHASRVVTYAPGAGYTLFPDSSLALGGPYGLPGGSMHVVSLGVQGELVLGFEPGRAMIDAPGDDLIVFENAFPGGAMTFAEFVRVGVSTNGIDYAFFPVLSTVPGPVSAYEPIDATLTSGFAGVSPVIANVIGNTVDPFDPAVAGGDAFDLSLLAADPLVTGSVVDLSRIYYVKCVDVLGDGTEPDALDRPIYDPTGVMDPPYSQPTSADIDAISVVNGRPAPTGGDATGDGSVDVFDLAALANHYGLPAGTTWEDGDFTGDGSVNLFDLAVLANNYGAGAGGSPVPGPTSLVLMLAAIGALRRRRRD